MSIPVPNEPVSIERQIKAVEREIGFRFKVYAGRCARGQMSVKEAGDEIAAMQAVLATLKAQQPDLFAQHAANTDESKCFHCVVSKMALERQGAGENSGSIAGHLLDVCADIVLSQLADKQDEIEDVMIVTLRRLVSEGRKILTASRH